MRNSSELEALKSNFNECKGNVEYYQDKFARVQAKLMDKVKKYKDLNKKKKCDD
jgi:phenylacetate-coenzyme A ligase PaaK-like adenylate-forming protein